MTAFNTQALQFIQKLNLPLNPTFFSSLFKRNENAIILERSNGGPRDGIDPLYVFRILIKKTPFNFSQYTKLKDNGLTHCENTLCGLFTGQMFPGLDVPHGRKLHLMPVLAAAGQ